MSPAIQMLQAARIPRASNLRVWRRKSLAILRSVYGTWLRLANGSEPYAAGFCSSDRELTLSNGVESVCRRARVAFWDRPSKSPARTQPERGFVFVRSDERARARWTPILPISGAGSVDRPT
jgi:hypothetical protein